MVAASKPTPSRGTASGHNRAADAQMRGRAAGPVNPATSAQRTWPVLGWRFDCERIDPGPGPPPAHGGPSCPRGEGSPFPGPSQASESLLGSHLRATLLKQMLSTRTTNEESEASKGSVTWEAFARQKSWVCPQLCVSVAATPAGTRPLALSLAPIRLQASTQAPPFRSVSLIDLEA